MSCQKTSTRENTAPLSNRTCPLCHLHPTPLHRRNQLFSASQLQIPSSKQMKSLRPKGTICDYYFLGRSSSSQSSWFERNVPSLEILSRVRSGITQTEGTPCWLRTRSSITRASAITNRNENIKHKADTTNTEASRKGRGIDCVEALGTIEGIGNEVIGKVFFWVRCNSSSAGAK